jgi:V8-like Glu-specific endopeptidase
MLGNFDKIVKIMISINNFIDERAVNQAVTTLLIAILAMVSVACGREPGPLSFPKIHGGEPVPAGEHPATVGIARSEPAGMRLICTGVLVAPQVVLTAGHCVDDVTPDALNELKLYVGDGVEGGLVEAAVSIAAAHASPHLRRHPLGYSDVAVLRLDAPLAGVTPAPLSASLADDTRLTQTDSPVTLVGYGEREDRGRGRKFQVTTTVTRSTSHEFVAGGGGRDACKGDSGGPVFAEGRLVGLVSRGIGLGCGDGGYVTRLAGHACWLNQTSGTTLFADPRLCPAPTPTYTDRQLARIDLRRLCGDKRLSVATRHTLEALLDALGVKDCAAAAELAPSVTDLKLEHRFLSDLLPLAALPNLKSLSLVGNQLTDAGALRRLRHLEDVDLTGNDVLNTQSLANSMARGLVIFGTRRQVSNVADTPFLRLCQDDATPATARLTIKAVLWKTMAEDCDTANERLLMLTTLNLRDRGLTDLSPLEGLQQLKKLDLSLNPLTDVTALAGLERLTALDLRATAVTDLAPLAPLVQRGLAIQVDAPE